MCGIVGYIGDSVASDILIGGLKRLEYRGYDSAGICTFEKNSLVTTKCKGKVSDLESKINKSLHSGKAGIGHTRWATHGGVTDTNAHPHSSNDGTISIVHNGIIENATELLEIGAARILEAQQQVIVERSARPAHGPEPFYPVWGHEALPRAPHELIADGAGSEVALLTGTNEDEMALWGVTGLSEDRVHRYTARMSPDADAVLACYRQRLSDVEPGWVACAIGTDRVFRIPAVRLAENRHANGAATWMYRFSWDSRAFDGQFGAAHALEIPFTFNTLDGPGTDAFLGEGPRPDALAETMHGAWIAFICDGDPSTPTLGDWPPYEPDHRLVMNLDDECDLLADPESDERDIWEGVVS